MGKTVRLDNVRRLAANAAVYYDTPSFYEQHIRILKSKVTFILSTGEELKIDEGFEWDEVSVPYLLQWAFPKSGKYAVSALVHDALYYARYKTRAFADDEFKRWMDVMINKNQSFIRWAFVRVFGWLFWRKNKRKPSDRLLRNIKKITIK